MGSVSVTRMESERNSVTEKPGDYQNGWSRCLPTMVYPLIVVFASVLGSLVVAELLLRGCNYYPSLQSGWVLKAPSARVPNRDVLLIPPKFLRASFYKTNPAHRTIVMLGDSFTESFPVKKQDSYPAILEGILTQQGIPTQVINAGIGDSGPDQHFRFLQQYLSPRLRPAVVVWALYANDISDNYIRPVYDIDQGELSPLDGIFNWLYIRQVVHLWAPLPQGVKQHSYLYRSLMKAIEFLGSYPLPDGSAKTPMAWGAEKLRLEMQGFQELAADRNFVGYLVLIAPQSVYLARTEPERWSRHWSIRQYEMILAMLKHEETFIHAWFPTAERGEIHVDSTRDSVKYGTRHFNEAGYRLLAETIARRILRDERLGPKVPN